LKEESTTSNQSQVNTSLRTIEGTRELCFQFLNSISLVLSWDLSSFLRPTLFFDYFLQRLFRLNSLPIEIEIGMKSKQ